MMEYKFTRQVEEDFDQIADGKQNYTTMLEKFWNDSLKKNIDNASEKAQKVVEKTGEKCPKCGEDLIYKFSKGGKFIGCS
jgi:DNA topoisomerase-1